MLAIYYEMEKLQFPNCDVYLRHYIVTNENTLKVIDHVRSFTRNRPIPKSLIKKLSNLGLLKSFSQHVKTIDNITYEKWKKTIEEYL